MKGKKGGRDADDARIESGENDGQERARRMRRIRRIRRIKQARRRDGAGDVKQENMPCDKIRKEEDAAERGFVWAACSRQETVAGGIPGC